MMMRPGETWLFSRVIDALNKMFWGRCDSDSCDNCDSTPKMIKAVASVATVAITIFKKFANELRIYVDRRA